MHEGLAFGRVLSAVMLIIARYQLREAPMFIGCFRGSIGRGAAHPEHHQMIIGSYRIVFGTRDIIVPVVPQLCERSFPYFMDSSKVQFPLNTICCARPLASSGQCIQSPENGDWLHAIMSRVDHGYRGIKSGESHNIKIGERFCMVQYGSFLARDIVPIAGV